MKRRILALTLACAAGAAGAQSFPTKPVRLVVPFLAGGSTDIVGRTVAQKLSEMWGQQVFVDNRPGGGTTIGTDNVAKSAPDGYSLLVTPAPFTINPSLLAKLPYDALNDFTPITLINTTPLVMVVHPGVPAKNVKEGFNTLVVLTDDGQVVTGIQVSRSDEELVLRDAIGKEVKIPTADIDEESAGTSLMPAGLIDGLSREELADLVRYLSELGR